jgi:hypothetical protein
MPKRRKQDEWLPQWSLKRYDGCLDREKLMKSLLLKAALLASVLLLGPYTACTTGMGGIEKSLALATTSGATVKNYDETEAAAALTKLEVPLQLDSGRHVRWIEATEGELSDEAMRLLPSLPRLEWLEIGGGSVTPAGITHLRNCQALRRLYIHDIDLEGEKLVWLSNLKRLEALSLQRTGVDGKILKNIKASGTLAVLNLSGDKIDDDDMGQIARLKDLEVLALADTKITGLGIAKLEGMKRLNELNIQNCDMQDDDLRSFLTMPNLRIVYAEGCYFTDMAVESMSSQYSMLAIFR